MKKLLCLHLLLLSLVGYGQSDSSVVQSDSTEYRAKDDFSLSGFPVVFFLPETSLSFGAAGIIVFNAGKKKHGVNHR